MGLREQMVALVRTGRSVEGLARKYESCAETTHEWVRRPATDDGNVHAELVDEGILVGRKHVECLIQAQNLRGCYRNLLVTTERDPRVRLAAGWWTGAEARITCVEFIQR